MDGQHNLRSKAEVLSVLRRSGVADTTIDALAEALDDPVDLDRDANLFFRYGITRETLADRMGASP